MPHFTVTKVEDAEEGAAASVSQGGEPGLARIEHSDEPGEYSVWELLKPVEFFAKQMVTKILRMEEKHCS